MLRGESDSNTFPVPVSGESQLPIHDPFLVTVVLAIEASIPKGEPSVTTTARAIGMSRRTLQRRLEQRGISHQQLLDTARRNLATVLLDKSDSTVAEIAIALGYRGERSFLRAFRRWTGMTPRAFSPRKTSRSPIDGEQGDSEQLEDRTEALVTQAPPPDELLLQSA